MTTRLCLWRRKTLLRPSESRSLKGICRGITHNISRPILTLYLSMYSLQCLGHISDVANFLVNTSFNAKMVYLAILSWVRSKNSLFLLLFCTTPPSSSLINITLSVMIVQMTMLMVMMMTTSSRDHFDDDKHRKNCECCHHHSLFKGHNVTVNIFVLNCQK